MRDGDELSPGAVAIDADTLGVRTKMTPASETIAAMSASDVTFADDEIAFGKTFDVIANAIDQSTTVLTNRGMKTARGLAVSDSDCSSVTGMALII